MQILLEAGLLFTILNRFKQARYILSVFAHLLKNAQLNDDESKEYNFRYLGYKAIYCCIFLKASEISKTYELSPEQLRRYFVLDDKVIPWSSRLFEEDTDLPILLLQTDAEFNKFKQEICDIGELIEASGLEFLVPIHVIKSLFLTAFMSL